MLVRGDIESAVRDCLVKAGTTFREDQIDAYKRAIEKEDNSNAKWVLERILENALIAEKRVLPLCDDTGIPHVFIELGDEAELPKGWAVSISSGIKEGLRAMPGRPMAVKGDDVERIEQSVGLSDDPADLVHAPMIVKNIPGRAVKITILLLGGGPEIRAKTYRVFHKRSMDNVIGEAAGWIASEVGNLGCTPCVAAVGIGRTHMEASALMLEAMKNGDLSIQSPWEKRITDLINDTQTGPLGLGGRKSALGAFINVGPLRASGIRVVSVRPCCCFEPRRSTVVLE